MSSDEPHIPIGQHPPVRNPDGTLNRAHFASRLRELNDRQKESLDTDRKGLQGYESLKKGILAEAEMLGLSQEAILDERSDADRVMDAINRMMDTGGESVLEETEATIAAMEKSIKAAIDGVQELIDAEKQAQLSEAVKIRTSREKRLGKQWLSLLERVRRLRTITREKIPKVRDRIPGHLTSEFDDAYEVTWFWRVAVYVYRSDLDAKTTAETIIETAPHHCKMIWRLWKARHGAKVYCTGTQEEIDRTPGVFWHGPLKDLWTIKKHAYKCEGMILIAPPRHGKSTIGTAWMTSEYIENARTQGILVHQDEDLASKNFGLVKSAFDITASAGRRCHALFGIRMAKEGKSSSEFRLMHRNRTRDPQLRAKGVRSGAGGANADIQWWDDPVKQEEAQQAEVREATFTKLTQQFLPRKQGKYPFVLVTATLWHYDDAVCRLIRQAQRNDKDSIPWAIHIQKVGGPNTKPPFFHIWKRYSPSVLRARFNEMQDPAGWSSQYMANPKPDELRIVKRLALYDPSTDQHADFLKNAEYHVSLDPSATSRDSTKKGTDKAGLVYAAVGDLVSARPVEGTTQIDRWRRVRVLDMREFYAGPTEAVDEVAQYAESNKVDRIHVEVVTFSVAIVELLKSRFGLTSSQVISHNANASKSKEVRLRSVSPMLEDSFRDQGLPGAVVEFPGVRREDGSLELDPKFAWAARQIIDFGAVDGDHIVDALTQLLKYLQNDVRPGGGEVSEFIRQFREPTRKEVARDLLRKAYQEDDEAAREETDPWSKEIEFMSQQLSGGFRWN